MMQALLKPIQISPYQIPNRIVMSPMTRARSVEQKPEKMTEVYYQQHALALWSPVFTALSSRRIARCPLSHQSQ